MGTLLFTLFFLFASLSASPIFGLENDVAMQDASTFPLSTLETHRRNALNQPTSNVLHLTRKFIAPAPMRRQISEMTELYSQTAYTAEVIIEGTTFNLLVDTGSSHTWITPPNNTCFNSLAGTSCQFPTHLSVPKSEKWLAPFFSGYMDGSNVTGGLIQRPLSIAGITIPDQIIGLASKAFIGRTDGSMDGLLGLGGVGGTGTPSYLPVFSSMESEGLIPENTFSIALLGTADLDDKRDAGLLAFGGIPKVVVPTSAWGRARILTDSFYAIQVHGFKFQGAEKITLSEDERVVLMDSGTFLTRLPGPVAQEVWNLLPGTPKDKCTGDVNEKCKDKSGYWKVPCAGNAPSFSVVIGDVALPISEENLIVSLKEHYCISGIVPQADDLPGILGETFMKNVVVVHDFTDLLEPMMEVATYKLS